VEALLLREQPLARVSLATAGVRGTGKPGGAASRHAIPAALAGLAALIATAAIIAQRRAEGRRRALRS
jgi:hypothetical protein